MIEEKVRVLYRVINDLVSKYQGYLTLIESQQQAIVNNNIEALNETNIALDEFSQDMLEMENRRKSTLKDISTLLGINITNIRELSAGYQGPGVSQVEAKVAELKELLNKVRVANKTNHKLVQKSREFIRSSIGIITGYTKQSKINQFQTYGQSGNMGNQKQQARNLINRSI